jgi:hypothetical protein
MQFGSQLEDALDSFDSHNEINQMEREKHLA